MDSINATGTNGWAIFVARGFEPECSVDITHYEDNWFKISRIDKPDCSIYVQAEEPDVQKPTIITGIHYN